MLCEIIKRDSFILERGYHPKNALIYVISGEFYCEINAKAYKVGSGKLFAFPMGVPFKRHVIKPIECVYIQFNGFPFNIAAGEVCVADSVRVRNNFSYIKVLTEHGENSKAEYFIKDLLWIMELEGGSKALNDETVNKCAEYLKENYYKKITLDLLSEVFSTSKQTLIAKFKRYFGITPIVYLNNLRIEKAKEMLKGESVRINEIFDICGFENMYYFSAVFKNYTGLSPTEYKKSVRLAL